MMSRLVQSCIRRVQMPAIGLTLLLGITASAGAAQSDLTACQREESLAENRIETCSRVIADQDQIPEIRAEAYLKRGSAQEDLDNLSEAIEDYTQAIKLNPEYRALYHYRGLAYQRDGKSDLAIADFSEALRLDPQDTEALVYRGLTYASQDAHDKALADYESALAIDPNDPEALTARGESYEAQGQREKALVDFRHALEYDADNEDARDGLQRLGAK